MLTPPHASLSVETIHADFPILQQFVRPGVPLIYFDNAASTQRPRQVIEAVDDCYRRYYSNVHRGSHTLSMKASDEYEAARRAMQLFINAEFPNEIIFTGGATAAINLVARSWGDQYLAPGDEILLTLMEHHSNIVPWQQLAARTGAIVKFVGLNSDGTLDHDNFVQLLSDKTRVIAVCGTSNVLGCRNDISAIVAARPDGSIVVVDAAQSAPHEKLDVQQWGADFVAISPHKMLAPSGIGVLYGKRALLDKMPPFLGGGSMISTVTTEGFLPGELPAKFEAGTPPIAQAIGLKAAIEYLQSIGMDQIQNHEHLLAARAMEQMNQIDGLKILGPAANMRAGIISFSVDRCNTHDIATLIDRYGVAIRDGHHCTMPLHRHYELAATCRCSFYLYNTEQEVDHFVDALKTVIQKLR
jgi:cysteine desulfurase / selenocysteine lyase